jgi:8-oxo-dGTP pyrophosphatase MutT (NUDIX family)
MVQLDDVAVERDVLKWGRVVGVLALDPVREEVVLTRQFRLGAYLALGECETLEIVAGRVDCEEDAADAARRECLEEIGVPATFLKPILSCSWPRSMQEGCPRGPAPCTSRSRSPWSGPGSAMPSRW